MSCASQIRILTQREVRPKITTVAVMSVNQVGNEGAVCAEARMIGNSHDVVESFTQSKSY